MNTKSIVYQLFALSGTIMLKTFDALVAVFCRNQPVFSHEYEQVERLLNEDYAAISQEFKSVYEAHQMPGIDRIYSLNTNIGQDKDWNGYPFVVFNYAFLSSMQNCPATAELLRSIPGCSSAMFSVLAPGKHILPHRGVYKGVDRILFTLKASEDGLCKIRVADQSISFKNGQLIAFDETFEHEVKNDSSEIRAVLYLDIYRSLPFPLNCFNKFIFELLRKSPYIQNILTNYKQEHATEVIPFIGGSKHH